MTPSPLPHEHLQRASKQTTQTLAWFDISRGLIVKKGEVQKYIFNKQHSRSVITASRRGNEWRFFTAFHDFFYIYLFMIQTVLVFFVHVSIHLPQQLNIKMAALLTNEEMLMLEIGLTIFSDKLCDFKYYITLCNHQVT